MLLIETKFPIVRPKSPKPRKGKEHKKNIIFQIQIVNFFCRIPCNAKKFPTGFLSIQQEDDHIFTREASDADSEKDTLHRDVPQDQHEEENVKEPSTADDEISTANDEIPTADEKTHHITADDEPRLDLKRPVPRRSG